jgi:hypothetical protein
VVGDRWLLDGKFLAGSLAGAHTPTPADIGHQLSCDEVVSYSNLNVTFGAVSAPITITAPPVPACTNESLTAPNDGSALRIALQCTGPVGFPLTYSVVTAPSHGALTAVDQTAGAVSYTPVAGFSGTDQFTYNAADDGGASTTATVVITVPAKSGGGGGPVGPGVANVGAKISYTFRVVGTKTSFHELKATGVTSGETVLLKCKGKGCSFKSRKIPVSAKGVADAVASLPKRKRKQGVVVKAGATLTMLVTAPHATGKAVTFKARKGAVPVKHVLCVAPGATTPSNC